MPENIKRYPNLKPRKPHWEKKKGTYRFCLTEESRIGLDNLYKLIGVRSASDLIEKIVRKQLNDNEISKLIDYLHSAR